MRGSPTGPVYGSCCGTLAGAGVVMPLGSGRGAAFGARVGVSFRWAFCRRKSGQVSSDWRSSESVESLGEAFGSVSGGEGVGYV